MSRPPYTLRRETVICRGLEEVFAFFSRAENLQVITPEWLHFRILSVHPEPMQKGTLISYALRIHGVRVRWTSEIVEWAPPHRFVDSQIKGPYRLWRHTHQFAAEGDNTRLTDEVQYAVPFGFLGRIGHRLKVRSDIEKIFSYREKKVRELFGVFPQDSFVA
jgi:ligand-binding SRPBCC domain-containing protein